MRVPILSNSEGTQAGLNEGAAAYPELVTQDLRTGVDLDRSRLLLIEIVRAPLPVAA